MTVRAECSTDDRFEKVKGRKLALGRALVVARFPKDERALIWRAYLDDHQDVAAVDGAKAP